MKYAPTAPFALKGVTFSLAHEDKVRSTITAPHL
jgi:hypothetical protein